MSDDTGGWPTPGDPQHQQPAAEATTNLPPAAWYADPEHPGQLRYWDGAAWTEHRAPAPAGSASPGTQPGWSGQQAWGTQPAWSQSAGAYAPARTNGMAIASLVLGIGQVLLWFIGAVLAVVFGHVALSQIRQDPSQQGRGMAIAGLVLGYLGGALSALWLLVVIAAVVGSSP